MSRNNSLSACCQEVSQVNKDKVSTCELYPCNLSEMLLKLSRIRIGGLESQRSKLSGCGGLSAMDQQSLDSNLSTLSEALDFLSCMSTHQVWVRSSEEEESAINCRPQTQSIFMWWSFCSSFNIYKRNQDDLKRVIKHWYNTKLWWIGQIWIWVTKVIKVRQSHFFGRYRFFNRFLFYFSIIAKEMIEYDKQNDKSTHSSTVNVEFVFHLVWLLYPYVYQS